MDINYLIVLVVLILSVVGNLTSNAKLKIFKKCLGKKQDWKEIIRIAEAHWNFLNKHGIEDLVLVRLRFRIHAMFCDLAKSNNEEDIDNFFIEVIMAGRVFSRNTILSDPARTALKEIFDDNLLSTLMSPRIDHYLRKENNLKATLRLLSRFIFWDEHGTPIPLAKVLEIKGIDILQIAVFENVQTEDLFKNLSFESLSNKEIGMVENLMAMYHSSPSDDYHLKVHQDNFIQLFKHQLVKT